MIYFIASENISEYIREYYRMVSIPPENAVYKGGGNCLVTEGEAAYGQMTSLLDGHPPGGDDILARIETAFGGGDDDIYKRIETAHDNGDGILTRIETAHGDDGVYIMNKLTGQKNFYPEMLFRHPFKEASGSAGPYIGLTPRFMHHNIYFFRISRGADHDINIANAYADEKHIDLSRSVESILNWLDARAGFTTEAAPVFTEAEKILLDGIAEKFRLTETMRREFYDLSEKYKRRNGDAAAVFTAPNSAYSSKKEAKAAYAEYRAKLLE